MFYTIWLVLQTLVTAAFWVQYSLAGVAVDKIKA
jgi:hypothetical protein